MSLQTILQSNTPESGPSMAARLREDTERTFDLSKITVEDLFGVIRNRIFPRLNKYIHQHTIWGTLPSRLIGSRRTDVVKESFISEVDQNASVANLNALVKTLIRTRISSMNGLYGVLLNAPIASNTLNIKPECFRALNRYLRKHVAGIRSFGLTVTLTETSLSYSFTAEASWNIAAVFKCWADNPEVICKLFQPLMRCLDGLPRHTI